MLKLPDFDELMDMAQNDPEGLESLRKQHINELINNADKSNQPRLRGLQFQIDAHRQIHDDSPMGSCMKISQLMHESFAELRGKLNQLTGVNDPLREFAQEVDIPNHQPADVLSFPSR